MHLPPFSGHINIVKANYFSRRILYSNSFIKYVVAYTVFLKCVLYSNMIFCHQIINETTFYNVSFTWMLTVFALRSYLTVLFSNIEKYQKWRRFSEVSKTDENFIDIRMHIKMRFVMTAFISLASILISNKNILLTRRQ